MISANGQPDLFHAARTSPVQVTAENGALKVRSPYSAVFVAELKRYIPVTARSWDNNSKCWFVSADHADTLKELIDRNYRCDVVMPTVMGAEKAEVLKYSFRAEYIGNTRRETGFSSVFVNGGWNAKIPEKVLKDWFNDSGSFATYYSMLGLEEQAKIEDIKKAYKRAARQWHPDICKEENAREMFEQIKGAYDVLADPIKRNKYNAGIQFERMAMTGGATPKSAHSSFVPMLRCGSLTVKGYKQLSTLIVQEILTWDDILNDAGQVMVSFWAGENHSIMWV